MGGATTDDEAAAGGGDGACASSKMMNEILHLENAFVVSFLNNHARRHADCS